MNARSISVEVPLGRSICLQVLYKLTAQLHADLVSMRVQLHTFLHKCFIA